MSNSEILRTSLHFYYENSDKDSSTQINNRSSPVLQKEVGENDMAALLQEQMKKNEQRYEELFSKHLELIENLPSLLSEKKVVLSDEESSSKKYKKQQGLFMRM